MSDQERVKQYQKIKKKLSIMNLFVMPILLLLIAVTPASKLLHQLALGISSNSVLSIALYFTFFSLLMLCYNLPISFYSGYVIEKRFDLSNHSFSSWSTDFLKGSLISFGYSLLLIEILYAFIHYFPQTWWLWAWAGFMLFSYVIGKIFPIFIVPLFYKYSPVPDEQLREKILAMGKAQGMPIENIYSINLSRTTKKANAAFMGLGKTKRVVLSDTLLEHFSHEEIETVMAHELGHFRHRDIIKQLFFGACASLIVFWLAFVCADPLLKSIGYEGMKDVAAMPLVFLLFLVVYFFITPLQNGFSRCVERAADRFALEQTGNVDAFISTMHKLSRLNYADPDPHPLYEWFFYNHPAIKKRIQMAQQFRGFNT